MNDFRDRREERRRHWESRLERHRGESHVATGLLLLVIGGVALTRSFGVPMPEWLYTWQMLLIAIGLFIGIKKGFRDGGWFVPILVGLAFLANDYILRGDLRRHIWPLILCIVGVTIILRSGRKKWFGTVPRRGNDIDALETVAPVQDQDFSQDDVINSTCIFSGAKKVILSKNFKGGEMVNIFGGCEIDLTQADMTTPAVLEVTAIFGGATLIVPSNWAIKSEAVTIFGGIGDKRKIMPMTDGPTKTLILKGTMIFGGMEIRSY
jgi:cell wall-active antibiotic response 4TMS protein YvqF